MVKLEYEKGPIGAVRMAQIFFGILVLSLAAAALSGENKYFYDATYGSDGFALFLGIITLLTVPLVLFNLLTRFIPETIYWYIFLIWEIFMNLFYFAGWIALAAQHAGTICLRITPNFCNIGKANAAMCAIAWLLYCFTTFSVVRAFMEFIKGSNANDSQPNGQNIAPTDTELAAMEKQQANSDSPQNPYNGEAQAATTATGEMSEVVVEPTIGDGEAASKV